MTWVMENLDVIGFALYAHLYLAVPAIFLSLLISVPIAYLATKHPKSREITLTSTGLLYAIPSLPLFVLMPIMVGVPLRSSTNVHIVLTIYGCALMVRAAADAFDSVDRDVLEAAQATGYGPGRLLFGVHLPLAGPAILAGLRVVSVSTISLTTVGAVLGITSLGSLFTDGFQRGILPEIITGLVLTIGLAVIIDVVISLLGNLVMPFNRTLRKAEGARA
ncbi:MAG: ABC transporter permease subunit [Actinomycetaceae bacterium]|nr:ABC transporter permease subunit [Actinomycetaceae bacterium]